MPSYQSKGMEKVDFVLLASFLMKKTACFFSFLLLGSLGWSCSPAPVSSSGVKVTAVENFIADIAQNIAGDRLIIHPLIPYGVEPHEFEPTPQDMVTVSESALLIINGGGLEGWLDAGLRNIGGTRMIVTASSGLSNRPDGVGSSSASVDPHFWLNPVLVKTYVSNILEAFIHIDPAGESVFRQNAKNYSAALDDLDRWISSQVSLIPAGRRILITNHESFGYFADRYGFKILGAIIPSISPDAQPSASQIADLIQKIHSSGAKAIFLEAGANTQLADQIAQETGCRVVTSLYTHSLTPPGGVASTYLDLMRYDVTILVEALR
jgi:ABC-type Zn uptake system ZnuABC Zn-binding protein ZnuA